MDRFYTVVLFVAIILLILILTYIGLKMANDKSKGTEQEVAYPPSYSKCPDYWKMEKVGELHKCRIPTFAEKHPNTGTIYNAKGENQLSSTNTQEYETGYINFDVNKWGGVCAMKHWANKYNIVWDGVTNYNKC